MNNRKRNILLSFCLSFCTVIYILLFKQVGYDDSYDSFVINLSVKQFTPFSMFDQHYLGVIGLRDLLKPIQNLVPDLEVFPIVYLGIIFFSIFLTLYVVNSLLLKDKNWLIKIIFSVILTVLLSDNLVSITHTRFATLFCGLGLIQLLYGNKRNNWFWILIFLFGMLTRPESAIGAMLIIGLGVIIFSRSIYPMLLAWRFPIASILIFFLVFNIHKAFTNRFEILIEPDVEYALSTQRVVDLKEMKTAEDSLRYEMIMQGMFVDEEFTNIPFIRSLISNQFRFNVNKYNQSIKNLVGFYRQFIFFPVFIFFIMLLARKNWWKVLLFSLSVFIVLSYLDYTVNLADRHFVSIQIIQVLLLLLLVLNNTNNRLVVLLLPFLVITALITAHISLDNYKGMYENTECLESAMNDFEKVYTNRDVIIGVSSFHLLDRNFNLKNKKYSKNRYLLYDAVNYSTVPRNKQYLSEVCSCNVSNATEMVNWICAKNVIILMNTERAKLWQRYLDYKLPDKYIVQADKNADLFNKPRCFEYLSVDDCLPWQVELKLSN